MKKTIYISRSFRLGASGDIEEGFDILHTFDLSEARSNIRLDWQHLTERERKNVRDCVEGYVVEVQEGETAKAAYDRLTDEDEFPCDPHYYEEFDGSEPEQEKLTAPELEAAVAETSNYPDADAYVCGVLLSPPFLDYNGNWFNARFGLEPQLRAVWQTINAPFRDFLKLIGLRQSDLSRLYFIPLRTVQGWALGEAQCAPYIRLMIARLQGFIN